MLDPFRIVLFAADEIWLPQASKLMRLLIVDDNPRMRRFLRSLLGDITEEVCEAENGRLGVARFLEWNPDAVLMDIRMPVMDGLQATERIMDLNPRAVVIIVTDFDLPAYREQADRAGARAYILKDDLSRLPAALLQVQNAVN